MVGYNGGMKYIHSNCAFCGSEVVRKQQSASANVRLHFCDIKCKASYQKLAKPVTKEWLYEQYVVKGKDCTQIARDVNRDPKSVWNWMKDFEIPTRPRGTGWQKQLICGFGESNPFYGKSHTQETKEKISRIAKSDGRVPWGKNNPHPRLSGPKSGNWKGGVTKERQAFYSTLEWRKAAKEVKKRDKNTCQLCGKKREKDEPFDIHHIVSFQCVELRACVNNLVLLCEPCHYWVHSKHNTQKKLIECISVPKQTDEIL